MARDQIRDYNAEQPADHKNLSGGTQPVDASRHVTTHKGDDEDTRDATAPSGGVHPQRPSTTPTTITGLGK